MKREKPVIERPERISTATPKAIVATIERIVPGGLGFGHTDGKTVLVSLSAPGDVVEVAPQRVNDRTVIGEIKQLNAPGPNRVEAACPHFGVCGGCDFQQLSYEAQLEAKAEIIKDGFRRMAGITLEEVELVPSPKQWAYRSRAEWMIDPKTLAFGYRKRGTHEILDVQVCPILEDPLEATRAALHERISFGDAPVSGELSAATDGSGVSLSPKVGDDAQPLLSVTLAGETIRYDASCFFQSNLSILEPFVAHVLDEAGSDVEGELIDLYSGVGLFTIPLARRFARVTGVESHQRSASLAHENARSAGLSNVSVSSLPVEQWLRRKAGGRAPSVIVLDPPRIGVDSESLERIAGLKAGKIVYVSCDPVTLARDVKALRETGYVLQRLRAFDMFPQTHHVETVATMVMSPE